jgi:hypothetical protein
MKAYLIVTGVSFALMAAAHLLIGIKNYGEENPDPWHILAPVIVLIVTTGFSAWTLMLIRRKPVS